MAPTPRASASRWAWLAPGALPALDGIVEGSWIAVVSAAIQTAVVHEPVRLGPLHFAVAAWIGLGWSRRRSHGRLDPIVLTLLALGAAVLGSLSLALANGRPEFVDLIPNRPDSWLLALALVRGTRHERRAEDDLVISTVLSIGLPGLALPWLIGGLANEPARTAFVAAAFPAMLLFATSGLLAVALARLEALRAESGIEWRTNRPWLLLILGLIGLLALVGVPAALLLGQPISSVASGLLGPLELLVLAAAIPFLFILWLVDLISGLIPSAQPTPGSPLPPSTPFQPGAPPSDASILALVLALAVAAGVVAAVVLLTLRVLGRMLAGSAEAEKDQRPIEERSIQLPRLAISRPRLRVPGLGHVRSPRTASEAYRALLFDFERHDHLARAPFETPAGHARRIGTGDPGLLGFTLLAADFQLERYAGLTLSAAETRRAIGRWRRLRARPTDLGRQRDRDRTG